MKSVQILRLVDTMTSQTAEGHLSLSLHFNMHIPAFDSYIDVPILSLTLGSDISLKQGCHLMVKIQFLRILHSYNTMIPNGIFCSIIMMK